MPKFSGTSKKRLATCDDPLQRLFNEVIKHHDCKVLKGYRSRDEQNGAYTSGRSGVPWPESKHNSMPSKGVDVAPYPLRWPDKLKGRDQEMEWRRWYMFVGLVRGIASQMNIEIRCGADWDGDFDIKDQNFHDLPHFELVE
jgi:hypothetical protein